MKTESDLVLFGRLEAHAAHHHDGVLTIIRNALGWRIGLGSPSRWTGTPLLVLGATFAEAALKALEIEAAPLIG